jgi:hypothetical protein
MRTTQPDDFIGAPTMNDDNALARTLHAAGPFAGLAQKLDLYGRFAGRWSMHARLQPAPGRFAEADGDIVFGWVLDGRMVQDVWSLPGWFYGTTLRIYDPSIDAWHILWNEPVRQYYTHMIGRPSGHGIVQLGKDKEGRDIRWSFGEITPEAFRWTGEVKNDDGSWFLQCDIRTKRLSR